MSNEDEIPEELWKVSAEAFYSLHSYVERLEAMCGDDSFLRFVAIDLIHQEMHNLMKPFKDKMKKAADKQINKAVLF
ncbi:MAG TPA: hypothetical protein VEP90_28385 [Methylomirabilota bacterium]|nr:hypothetical protein [Methylomirabilota bacterium]